MTVRTVLIGDADRAEFREIVGWHASLAIARTPALSTIAAALADADIAKADLIIVLESHPDEYSPAQIEALFAAAPLARVVCCAGQWSESAGRTRRTWPVALCVPAVSAIARLEREWRLVTESQLDFWLPATGDRQESFAAKHPTIPQLAGRAGVVRVISPDADYRAMLVDVLRAVGWEVVNEGVVKPGLGFDHPGFLFESLPGRESPANQSLSRALDCESTVVERSPPHPNPLPHGGEGTEPKTCGRRVVVWDADPWDVSRISEVERLTASMPVIAVSGWMTPEVEAELLSAGVKAVVPKLGDVNRIVRILAESRFVKAQTGM